MVFPWFSMVSCRFRTDLRPDRHILGPVLQSCRWQEALEWLEPTDVVGALVPLGLKWPSRLCLDKIQELIGYLNQLK